MLSKIKEINQEKLDFVLSLDLEMKLELLQNQIKLSQVLVENILETEVLELSGKRYSHVKPNAGRYSRWGTSAGYVVTDVNGDEIVDGSDLAIQDNNAFNFVGVARPPL